MDNSKKVQKLLTAFQSSLISHLISKASNREESSSYIGESFQLLEEPEEKPSVESVQVSRMFQEHISEELEASFGQQEVPEESEFKVFSEPNDIFDLERCSGRVKKHFAPKETLEFEYEINESYSGSYSGTLSAPSKVLQRKNAQLLNKQQIISFEMPIQQSGTEPTPVKPLLSPQSEDSKTLYGEVIATTYSQGGDGFVLHPGDFVTILQFLEEYGMVECKWQGLQGLFPQDKIRVLTNHTQDFNSSILSLARKQLLNLSSKTVQNSKLMKRIAKRQTG